MQPSRVASVTARASGAGDASMDEPCGPRRAGVTAMNTVLYCRRWRETVAFYEQVLGLERSFANGWFVELHVAAGCFLSLADERHASVKGAGGAGITLSLRVNDVHRFRDALAARGAGPPPVSARPWGALGFLIHDPEGTRIEVWAPAAPARRARRQSLPTA
jgi:uncharacterized glyoxalase superfamily protein PhnB